MKYEEVIETFGGGACLKKVVLWGKMQSLKGMSGPGSFSNPCFMAAMQRTNSFAPDSVSPNPQQWPNGLAQELLKLLVNIFL